MTAQFKNDDAALHPKSLVTDSFSDDRAAGETVGTLSSSGAIRLGCDAERQMAIDHGALRFQPLTVPGWARQGISYGPFQRASGLVLAVSITNGHNTSQGSPIPEHIGARLWRWMLGPGADSPVSRLAGWIRAPRKALTLRRLLWWARSTARIYKAPRLNENLAVGFFTSPAPANPLVDGCGFVMHAAEGENGELWARVGDRCLSAFRQLQNLQICYFVALRERGAIYYAAAIDDAKHLPGAPSMRPIAIDSFNTDETLFAGIHQSVLGQIGFRVDTRLHGVHIARVPEFVPFFTTAHAAAARPFDGAVPGTPQVGGPWQISRRPDQFAKQGVDDIVATLHPASPSGLIHILIHTAASPDDVGLVWRARNARNCWLLKVTASAASLVLIENGTETVVASDVGSRLAPNGTYSLQILDRDGQFGCYLNGKQIFDGWFEDNRLASETGVGIWSPGANGIDLQEFEAHPQDVPVPAILRFDPPWARRGERTELFDDFAGAAGDIANRKPTEGLGHWQKTLGSGAIEIAPGEKAARVRGSVEKPHPGRTFYTLPWSHPDFADLEVRITPPGERRGQSHACRCGLVFWQDNANYLSFTAYLDDAYNGASLALFTKRHGFEELYDAIWTMVWTKVDWGKPFDLRVAFDGDHFIVFVNSEPVMQRALTDIYPDDPPFRITRVGIAVNWEWGNDTGSIFHSFAGRC